MKPLPRLGDREREVIEQRSGSGYATPEMTRFDGVLELTLRALLGQLLPGVPASIDLAAFVDTHTGRALGRGDRRAGLPAEPELFVAGLVALTAANFAGLPDAEQRALITRMRHGAADEQLGLPAKDFIDRLLDKALAGYLAHPDTWVRIGFNGPAYPDGYAWIGPAEAIARHRKAPGWDQL